MKITSPSRQSGFTLLELLLVVGVAAILMLGAAQMVRSWATTQSAKGAGTQLQNLTSTVNDFVTANWTSLTQATDNIMNDSDWTDLQTKLIEGGMIDPNTGQILSPIGTPLQIAFQIDTADPTNRIFRTIIFSTRTLPNAKIVAAARQGGAYAGTWAKFPDDVNIHGAYGQWRKNPSILTSAPIGLAPPTQTEGYLVSVLEIEEAQAVGPYLYRDAIPNEPGANSMGADLDMDGNDITGLNSLETGILTVTDTANFNNMTVTGDSQFPNGMNVQGQLNTQDLNVGTLTAGQIAASAISSGLLTINNGNLIVDGDLDLTTGNLTAAGLNAANCIVVAGVQYADDPTTCPP